MAQFIKLKNIMDTQQVSLNKEEENKLDLNSQNQKTINLNDYATSFDYNNFYCPHKLPCGYCSFMNRPCIKHEYSFTWNTATNPLTTTTTTTTTTMEEGN